MSIRTDTNGFLLVSKTSPIFANCTKIALSLALAVATINPEFTVEKYSDLLIVGLV